jgi:hypothetical protein
VVEPVERQTTVQTSSVDGLALVAAVTPELVGWDVGGDGQA